MSEFIIFFDERRRSVQQENSDITFRNLSKKLAAEWSELTEPEKKMYTELVIKDKRDKSMG